MMIYTYIPYRHYLTVQCTHLAIQLNVSLPMIRNGAEDLIYAN
jgi:hypothetical protein